MEVVLHEWRQMQWIQRETRESSLVSHVDQHNWYLESVEHPPSPESSPATSTCSSVFSLGSKDNVFVDNLRGKVSMNGKMQRT